MPAHGNPFAALADQLTDRRDAILNAWRRAVSADTSLTSGDALPHAQLNDHIPAVLEGFEAHLRSESSEAERLGDAAAHGLHRWQQGFGLSEVVRELGRLNECVVSELESLAAGPPVHAPEVMARARLAWAQVYSVAVGASTNQYFKLQQIEATAYTRSLEQGLETLRRMEQQRAQLWQEAAHDLRGNLGVVSNATQGLGTPNADPAVRETFLRLLGKNVKALHHLLDDVTTLARLQSGQEERHIERVDVAPLFRELWESLEGHAQQKGLTFKLNGHTPFEVRSDAVKLYRIAQNLLLNAIRYTHKGGLELSWSDCGAEDPDRWMLVVSDTGPGIGNGGSSELKNALEVATQHADQVAFDSKEDKVTHIEEEDAGVPEPGATPQTDRHGEGIGLSIVKRLCELLDATVQVESSVSGTRFEILFPRAYD
ncbi:sensor histidine kinase [Hydrogenophaga sp.]|jgi:signal transduction histidine kinase|uniref:sensor histidine kinase n=1 Tax=Hydrogenophaga sp. TaxID=1904254 RepID=UPI003F72A286